jgi:hypothetical protein
MNSSPGITGKIKSRMVERTRHAARMGEKMNAQTYQWESQNERAHQEYQDTGWQI